MRIVTNRMFATRYVKGDDAAVDCLALEQKSPTAKVHYFHDGDVILLKVRSRKSDKFLGWVANRDLEDAR